MQRLGRFLFSVSLAAVVAVSLGSCSAARNQVALDRSGDFEREDYRKMLAPRALPQEAQAPIPELESLVAMPEELKANMPIISISVNQTVPLRDVMFELADQAGIDIELDPQIRGSIIFTARQRPFDEVIARICDMAGLNWYFDHDVLRVEIDRPYIKTYKVDYLNLVRKLKSGISTDISVVTGEGADVGSKASVETTVESDFWTDIESNIEQILASTDTYVSLATLADPQAQPRAAAIPQPMPATPGAPVPQASGVPPAASVGVPAPIQQSPPPSNQQGIPPRSGDAGSNKMNAITPAAGDEVQMAQLADTAMAGQVAGQMGAATMGTDAQAVNNANNFSGANGNIPQGSINAAANPAASFVAGPPTLNIQIPTTPSDPPVPNPPATFSLSKQSGLITIFANDRQQKQVAKYLERVRRNMTSQVLIEAKILQVVLTDEYAAGINWNEIDGVNITGLVNLTGSFDRPALVPNASGSTFGGVLQAGRDLNVAVDALSRFGTIRALASPRVTVLNSQAAVLNMARNNVFFDLKAEVNTDSDTNISTVSVDSKAKSVPEGVMLNVLPMINLESGEISMSVRPTITRIEGTVSDPAIALTLATANVPDLAGLLAEVDNPIPELAVQEIDSLIKMQSGQVMVLGGLMQDRSTVEEVGVPLLGDIPMLGNLFKNHADKIEKSELVIFIKATIIPGSSVENMDRELYNGFSKDRRPFKM